MLVVGLLFLVAFIEKCCTESIVEADKSLKVVAVLYRHGDRAPISSYPGDPSFDEEYWPEGYGQLLKTGKQRQYKLGKFLRDRYDKFLGAEYSRNEIFVRSSDLDRTLMSAGSNLAGLYSRSTDDTFEDNLNWEPIPIHTLPKQNDPIIYMDAPCAQYQQLNREAAKAQYKEMLAEYPDFFELVSNKTSWAIHEIDFETLYGTFYCYEQYQKANTSVSLLPEWYSLLNQTIFTYIAGRTFTYENTIDLKRLGSGPFITYLTNHLDKAINGSASKFLMLSGHDSTIAPVLNAMNVYDYEPPEFASMVIWELYQEPDGKYTIEVYYKKNSDREPDRLKVNNCEESCSYDKFKDFLQPLIIDDLTYAEECIIQVNSASLATMPLWTLSLSVLFYMILNM